MYREGPNKLILYPDDIVFIKTQKTVKHTTPVSYMIYILKYHCMNVFLCEMH